MTIKEARIERGLTQKQLGEILGVGWPHILKLEKVKVGDHIPISFHLWAKIVAALPEIDRDYYLSLGLADPRH